METTLNLFASLMPGNPLSLVVGMIAVGMTIVAWSVYAGRAERSGVKRRLVLETPAEQFVERQIEPKRADSVVSAATLNKARDFYAKNDPETVARLRMKLIQAGFMEPGAVGYFFVARFALLAVFFLAAFAYTNLGAQEASLASRWGFVFGAGAFGYFLPTLWLHRQAATKLVEYRNGFPDFMDLMIVCADAGMSLESAVDRVSREITKTYPSLSQNLMLVTIELRAGRQMEDALKALSERIGLDEVRSFATLLQQSKELGTSLSQALRVFSDEMRHKRMSKAEEKAHSLPAKMSVPVTMCILPVVMLVAVIPIIVQVSGAQ
jgi:tight adherence protein C